MRKYMKIASLVGLGLTASIMAFASPWGYGNHHNYDRAKIEAFMELPTEKQTLILDSIKKVHSENSELRQELLLTKESLIEVLTAPTFEKEEFEMNVDKLESLMTQGLRAIAEGVIEAAPQLSQEEREALAQMAPHRGPFNHGPDRIEKD